MKGTTPCFRFRPDLFKIDVVIKTDKIKADNNKSAEYIAPVICFLRAGK